MALIGSIESDFHAKIQTKRFHAEVIDLTFIHLFTYSSSSKGSL